MPRKPRPLERDSDVVRDANLIVIASEDTHAVQTYFQRFRPRRVQFKVLPTDDCRSAPTFIAERLDQFRREYNLDDDDQLWYCGDIDHWARGNHISNLRMVLQHCRQAKYHVALSNPCFELWLLLHFIDLPVGMTLCADVCQQLSGVGGGYSKEHGCGTELNSNMVWEAVRRANALDVGTDEIPDRVTTRVYRILDLLLKREQIVVGDIPQN